MLATANAGVQMNSTMSLAFLKESNPTESMEIAKKIIGNQLSVDMKVLCQLALDKNLEKWPRIAAIYALGFVGGGRFSKKIRKILSDQSDDVEIRAHAAEAIGNIGDRTAIEILRRTFEQAQAHSLRESCSYALHELGA